ncbi:branched-chain amino acid ABC transporter permease [Paralimibaculum aggregatum]|uniref:Branched-chain amino acid ABC transporter permease n=1 Tax=Paralimibaculum aggregatum TaxID=3036245 RepID=A0ABQ6LNZ4_9RHOB|nr:branched-chain amino acid ABC transporter permease [Limibaculum sp. NKW23]GMG84949.1 branched-chain amino acid ABC transporter permease [Limibaculum sp. NKW23]
MATVFGTIAVLALAVAGFFVPAAFGGGGAVYSACVLIAIFAVMAYGLDLIVSDLGEVSLGHPVFFASGAYATALLSTEAGLSPVLTFVASLAVAMALALLVGFITLRLREFVFSLVTYAVTVVALTLAENWSALGGSDGIAGIPLFTVDAGIASFRAVTDRDLWPVAYGLLLATLWLVSAFRRSRLGNAALKVHLNPRLATMSGIDPQKTRLMVFLVSAPMTAAAGWLYAYQRAYISADLLSPYFLILMLTAVVIIGRRLLLAPLMGVALILVQEKFFSFGGDVDRIILGCALIVSLAFLPGGIAGTARALAARIRRSDDPARTNAKNEGAT